MTAANRRRRTPTYEIWCAMRARCRTNPAYIKKQITVCKRWDSYQKFLDDVGPRPSKRYSLDRLDTSKGYRKNNVRWATRIEQNNNTSRNIWKGGRLAPLLRKHKIAPSTFYTRVRLGMSVEEALTARRYYNRAPTKPKSHVVCTASTQPKRRANAR